MIKIKIHKYALSALLLFVYFSSFSQKQEFIVRNAEYVKNRQLQVGMLYTMVPFGGVTNLSDTSLFFVHKTRIDNPEFLKYPLDTTEWNLKKKLTLELERRNAGYRSSYNIDSVKLIRGYVSNSFDNRTPMDNHIAVANNGLVISVVNTNIRIYNENDSLLQSRIMSPGFFDDASLTSTIFDPRIIYDPQNDRFILVVLHGSSAATSKVLVCFSKSNTPHIEGWNVYKLNGDAFANGLWFDYPNIGISNEELFITGNLFREVGSNDDFENSTIFQINKNDGFSGAANLRMLVWGGPTVNSSIKNSDGAIPFTLVPVSYGKQGGYGPGIFIISTASNQGNAVYVHEITTTLENNPKLLASKSSIPDYQRINGKSAVQQGTNVVLNSGDSRMQSGFFMDGIIHCVFSVSVNFFSAINYVRIDAENLVARNRVFYSDGVDLSYPAVASFSNDSINLSVGIVYTFCNTVNYPGIAFVVCDHNMDFSEPLMVKEGEFFNNFLPNSGVARWGDYSGIAKKYNAPQPQLWVSGSFGKRIGLSQNGVWNNFNALLSTKDFVFPQGTSVAIAFPNPIQKLETASVLLNLKTSASVEIKLYDQTGKLVKIILQENLLKGNTLVTFSVNDFSSGIYFLVIFENNKKVETQKIIVR